MWMYENKRYRIHEAWKNPTDSADALKAIRLKLCPNWKKTYSILHPPERSHKVLQNVLHYTKYMTSLLECVDREIHLSFRRDTNNFIVS